MIHSIVKDLLRKKMYLLDNGIQFKQVKMHPNSQQRKTPTKQKDKLLRGENTCG